MGARDAYLLAEHINQFYLEAFNHALVVVGIVFGLVGVIVPVGIAFFQTRQAKSELEQLKRQISSEVAAAVSKEIIAEKEALLKEQAAALVAFQERSDKVVADLKREIDKEVSGIKAHTFHLQAITAKNEGLPTVVIVSACSAIDMYLAANDAGNTRKVCVHLLVDALKMVNAESFKKTKSMQAGCDKTLSSLRAQNIGGRFTDLIQNFETELGESLDRAAAPDAD